MAGIPAAAQPYSEGTLTYAGFWARLGALLIDALLLGIVGAVIGFMLGVSYATVGVRPSLSWGLSNLINFLLALAYFTLMESSPRQATLGKMALGLRVTDINGARLTAGTAALRHLSKMLSSLTLGIGFLMAAFTARKQALHDLVAGTLVLKG